MRHGTQITAQRWEDMPKHLRKFWKVRRYHHTNDVLWITLKARPTGVVNATNSS